MLAVPQRLEQGVGEAEVLEVLDRLLAEVVVDPEHRALGEHGVQRGIKLRRRGRVAAEGLLDDDARALGDARLVEAVDHRFKEARWDREVVQRVAAGIAQLAAERLEGRLIGIVAVDVAQ